MSLSKGESMKKALVLATLLFACLAHANSQITCQVVRVYFDKNMDKSEVPSTASIKTATITFVGNQATLIAVDGRGKPVVFADRSGKPTTRADFTVRNDKSGPDKIAYQANDASVADTGYGDQFWIFISSKEHMIRVWSASIGEPDDDSGKQALFDNTSVVMACR
jgi:hypothetical protein